MNDRDLMIEGTVRWSPHTERIGVRACGDRMELHVLDSDPIAVTTRVAPPGLARFLRGPRKEIRRELPTHRGYSFAPVAPDGETWTRIGVQTAKLKRLPPGEEVVPAQVAVASLSMLLEESHPLVGIHWSDGTHVIEVLVQNEFLYVVDPTDIDRMRDDVPWADFSPDGTGTSRPGIVRVPNSSPFDGSIALAAGGAMSTLRGIGNFVNPKPQTMRFPDGQLRTTIPNPRTQIAY